jgi:predicted O-linked N-acetylglucosamine transferase (SPINDLY family)
VLWLIREDPLAETNLRNEAASRQIDPERLIFSDKIDKPAHLARHRLADLFLDTHAVNAHTGASDALWAGLPLLTCPGATFTTRVAASLLNAVGLPELAVANLEDYKKLAVQLAQDSNALANLRGKLDRQRLTHPLFDTQSFVRNLEAAYARMHEVSRSGRPPESFSVPDRAATPVEPATTSARGS